MSRIRCRLLALICISCVVPNPEVSAQNPAGTVVSFPVGTRTGEKWNDNPLKIEFLWCAPGKFTMGSPKNEKDRGENEDQVEVTLTKGFWLGKYEVTQEQWRSVMNTEPWLDHRRVRIAPDSPACWVSWEVANLFCRELTRADRSAGVIPEGWDYVLPTEAQWEYACRAGTTTKFSFGDDDKKLDDFASYGEEHRRPQQMHARAVGTKKPNPWGFYDMHGNVVEWCRDWFQPKYPGGTDPFVSMDQGTGVTARGGEWRQPLHWSRSAHRQSLGNDGIAATIGFRVSLQQMAAKESVEKKNTTLAVIPFENTGRSVKYDRLGRAISGLLVGSLSRYATMDVLERQSVQGLQTEASLSGQGRTKDGPNVGSRKDAQYVLTGTCGVEKDRVTVTAKLNQIGVGKPVGEWKLSGSVKELLKIEADLSSRIVNTLGIPADFRTTPPLSSPAGQPVVAVLPFFNDSPTARLDDMELGFAELFQLALTEVSGVRLVERQVLEKILSEQNLTEAGLVDDSTAVAIGKLAGANVLLTGSFLELDSQLSIQVRTMNAATGTIIGTARVADEASHFGELIEQLTKQVTAGMTAEISAASDATGNETRNVRRNHGTLESAMHIAAAAKFRREGNLQKAKEAFENAILLEPENPDFHLHLILLQQEQSDDEGMVQTGEHMLQAEQSLNRFQSRERFLIAFVGACVSTGRVEQAAALLEKYRDVSDTFRNHATSHVSSGYIRLKQYPKAVAVMEKLAEEDVAKNGVMKSQALRELFYFNYEHATSVVGIPLKDHQIATRKAIEIYERVLKAAATEKGDEASRIAWAQWIIPNAVNILYLTDDNRKVPYFDDEKKATFRKREAEIFGDNSGIRYRKLMDDALAAEASGRVKEAIDGFRQYLDDSVGLSDDYIMPSPIQFTHFSDWIDLRIEARSRTARILANELNRPAEARKVLQELVEENGLVHFAGPEVLVLMNRLELSPSIPQNSVLVWGGTTSNYNGWKRVGNAEQLVTHGIRKPVVTLADLAAYTVVVLNDSSAFPMMPSEVLALRNYVASGGSLLVIVSSSWAPESPVTRSELLSFFDMEVSRTPTKSAASTRIRPHAITEGIISFTAWNAAGLTAPDDSVLIQSGENAILAAKEYGRGRIVVSSAGQWFTPEILLIPENEEPRRVVATTDGAGDPTFFRPPTPEPPLLRQVLRWLAEPREQDREFLVWQAKWKKVMFQVQQAQACLYPAEHRIVSWDQLPPLFDQLMNSTAAADLKQEALWAAGESLLSGSAVHSSLDQKGFPRRAVSEKLEMMRQAYGESLSSHPEYFERLVKLSSKSPLRPYAVLRKLDCRRVDGLSQDFSGPEEYIRVVNQICDEYEKADLEKGSWAYQWGLLHCGQLHFSLDDYGLAAKTFDEVAASSPVSAPKAIALLNAARSYALDENYDEALRRLSQAEPLPNFTGHGHYRQFEADSEASTTFLRETRYDIIFAIKELRERIPRMKSDAEFLDWKKRLKIFKETGVFPPPEDTDDGTSQK